MSIQTPAERTAALHAAACALDVLMVAHEGIHHAFFMGGDMEEAAWHTAQLLRTAEALRTAIGPGLVDLARVEQAAADAYAGQLGTVLAIDPGKPGADRTVEWEGPRHEA